MLNLYQCCQIGAVIETIVARTLRYVESSQKMVRIVGLSATLPNYIDVAHFLKINTNTGKDRPIQKFTKYHY